MKNQATILRRFSGRKRLGIALRLSALVRELAMNGIKAQNPKANKREIINLWVKEISLSS